MEETGAVLTFTDVSRAALEECRDHSTGMDTRLTAFGCLDWTGAFEAS